MKCFEIVGDGLVEVTPVDDGSMRRTPAQLRPAVRAFRRYVPPSAWKRCVAAAALLLMGVAATVGLLLRRPDTPAPIAERPEEARQSDLAATVCVADDGNLTDAEYCRRHQWFFDREQEIMDAANGNLRTECVPVPEIWQHTNGLVSLSIRNVRWEPRRVPSEPKAPEPVEMHRTATFLEELGEIDEGPALQEELAASDG